MAISVRESKIRQLVADAKRRHTGAVRRNAVDEPIIRLVNPRQMLAQCAGIELQLLREWSIQSDRLVKCATQFVPHRCSIGHAPSSRRQIGHVRPFPTEVLWIPAILEGARVSENLPASHSLKSCGDIPSRGEEQLYPPLDAGRKSGRTALRRFSSARNCWAPWLGDPKGRSALAGEAPSAARSRIGA